MTVPSYQSGFGNNFASEAISGALPLGQNSPQQVPFGLYAEQLSGTAFTTPKSENRRSWLYRILPSVRQEDFIAIDRKFIRGPNDIHHPTPPNQLRWDPLPEIIKKVDFIDGWHTFAVNGDIKNHSGAAIHCYCCNQSMQKRYFYDADGELLIVPQAGIMDFHTEMGLIQVEPGEIIVIPRGLKFRVSLQGTFGRGYICENFGRPFTLPERGPIGANGLANERDFLYPVAAYEDKQGDFYLDTKFFGHLWRAKLDHSPLNVVAWHGNYAPYKYPLKAFNAINSVTFDHPDPSIFTVLTTSTPMTGIANIDFVVFRDRWMVAEHTFRPPYYHRNIMSEFMGLIEGAYDAKKEGFYPGGGSLHNSMSAHGPDAQTYKAAKTANLKPEYYKNTLAFMFESYYVWQPTPFALETPLRQKDYLHHWDDLPHNFSAS